MPPSKASKSCSDTINFLAGIIGIFGFLTGISSIPSLLTKNDEPLNFSSYWFSEAIPYTISIPIFVISLLFVYGLFFIAVFRSNQWLRSQGIIKKHNPSQIYAVGESGLYAERAGDYFSIIFFTALGISIGFIIIEAFFGSSGDDLGKMLTTMGMGIFVFFLCYAAKDAASR